MLPPPGESVQRVTGTPHPLTLAIVRDDVAKVEQLLAAADDVRSYVNSRQEEEVTPLISAAAHGNVEILRKLLEVGADINAVCSNGQTALMRAAMYEKSEVVQELLQPKWKADMNVVDKHGMTALMFAAGSSLSSEDKPGHITTIRSLLRGGANPAIQQPGTGITALMLAVVGGSRIEEIRALVEESSSNEHLDVQDNEGRTALMWAAVGKRADVKEYLKKQGANTKLVDKNGMAAQNYESLGK